VDDIKKGNFIHIVFPPLDTPERARVWSTIIHSMTDEERANPKLVSEQRRKRIARGAGVAESHVKELLKQYKQSPIALVAGYRLSDQEEGKTAFVLSLELLVVGIIEKAVFEKTIPQVEKGHNFTMVFEEYVDIAKQVVNAFCRESKYRELTRRGSQHLAKQIMNEILQLWSRVDLNLFFRK
jgi:hypothetical protein